MTHYKSFTDFAKEINLVDYLVTQEGYQIDKEKSARNVYAGWVVLDLKESAGASIETLLVKYTSDKFSPFYEQFFYINANDRNDKGSIVNFISKKRGLDKKLDSAKINEILNRFLGNPVQASSVKHDKSLLKHNSTVFDSSQLKPLTSHAFFSSRAINSKTLNHPFFINKILEHHNYDHALEKLFINPAFPMVNSNGEVVGAELKNKDFKGNALNSQKAESVFISNKIPGQLKYFFVAESGLDCLSHFQLNFETLCNSNVLYLSTGGNLVSGQLKVIDYYLKEYKPQNFVLINDNDQQGVVYNINLIAHCADNLSLFIQKNKGIATIEVHKDDSLISAILKKYSFEFKTFIQDERKQFEFSSDVVVLKYIERNLAAVANVNSKILVQRANGKDFNEDLIKLNSNGFSLEL